MPDASRFRAFPTAGVDAMTASTARAFPRHTHDQCGVDVVDAGGHASLLRDTRRSIAEAAATAGFYDQSHLTRCFVRHLGVTPRRYARRSA